MASFAAVGANVTVPGVVTSSSSGNWSIQAWIYRPANTGGPIAALAYMYWFIDGICHARRDTPRRLVKM